MIVRPGWVATRMTEGRDPAPFATTPDAVAADVVAGMERSASVVWSPGPLRLVFAVMKLVPAAVAPAPGLSPAPVPGQERRRALMLRRT